MYKVEQNFGYGWDDAPWNVDGEPMRFASEKEAQAEIDDLIKDTKEAFEAGDMDEAYDPDDYRIVPANI